MNPAIKTFFERNFTYKITTTSKNINMKESNNMFHYKIRITNKRTKKNNSFTYSVGLGHKQEDRTDEKLLYGLIECFFLDKVYATIEDLKDLGYDDKECERLLKVITKQRQDIQRIGLDALFDFDFENEVNV